MRDSQRLMEGARIGRTWTHGIWFSKYPPRSRNNKVVSPFTPAEDELLAQGIVSLGADYQAVSRRLFAGVKSDAVSHSSAPAEVAWVEGHQGTDSVKPAPRSSSSAAAAVSSFHCCCGSHLCASRLSLHRPAFSLRSSPPDVRASARPGPTTTRSRRPWIGSWDLCHPGRSSSSTG